MTACNPQTPWRDTGDTTPGAFGAELVGTPIFPERDALCDGASPYGRLYLAHSQAENRHDTVGILIDPTMHNNLALRPRGYPEETGVVNGFARFASYEGCLMAWRRRLADPALCYVPTVALLDYSACYNPSTDVHPVTGERNDPARYCDRLLATINRLPLDTEEPMPFTTPIPGLPKAITTSFPVRIALMPATQTNQRPGHPFTGGNWDWYTQHETANTKPGANVRMHEAWLRSDPGQVGFHLCVDDKEAAVFVPLDEVAWHAGDSGGPGNFDSIACELCVNSDGNKAKARSNAEELAAAILTARGLPAGALVQHNRWSGKDCPMQMRAEGYWPTFVANVAARMQPTAPPSDDLDYPPGWDQAIASAVWGDKYPDYTFNPAGTVSPLWLSLGITSPLVYHFKDTTDGRELFVFSSGDTIGRLNKNESFRLLA
jgi:N-acetylmuramoyl-L-alanine amidase